MDTITLSKAKSELRIGRERLLKLLKDCQIEVIQVNAQRKEITLEQLAHLRSIIANGTEAIPYQNTTQVNSGQLRWLTGVPWSSLELSGALQCSPVLSGALRCSPVLSGALLFILCIFS